MEREGKVMKFTRRALYDIMQSFAGTNCDEKFKSLEQHLIESTKCPEEGKSVLFRSLKHFKSDLKQKWKASNYIHSRFIKKNERWLAGSLSFPVWAVQKTGRPQKEFQELSERSKRRKTMELREHIPVEQLVFAASISQRATGNTDASNIIKEITSSPTRAKKYRRSITTSQRQLGLIKNYSPQEALSLFVDGGFTKRQWEIIHGSNKTIYPSYSKLTEAKKACYPPENATRVTETCAEIKLQALLDHTTSRICEYSKEVISTCTDNEKQNMKLIVKWGCDGSQQTQFKQKFENTTDSDANIFQSSLVPIRLVAGDKNKIIWQNPVPSSVRFCRPIRIRFIHENKDITNEEIKYIEEQARHLLETICDTGVKVNYTLLPTMVDGKICNAATNTASTMRCYICGQTSKDFNKLQDTTQINTDSLKFGLSILHARIRFFEALLHLSYKLPLKKWQARSAEDKKIVKERKEKIQNDFKERMGLLVDIPKAGFGNTNDGNTSRRFFADPVIASEITGISKELIVKFKIILETLSSGFEIDTEKFDKYAKATARLYVELYGWHPMSPTIHKILMHGAVVISHAIVPIGHLSEEAAEARNKHFRQYRIHYARKCSRELCNKDILNRLLLTSDPLLSSCRRRPQKRTPFSTETLHLLVAGSQSLSEISNEINPSDCESE